MFGTRVTWSPGAMNPHHYQLPDSINWHNLSYA